jgi:cobalt-zinc-cadmium efflux system outer membrane protein
MSKLVSNYPEVSLAAVAMKTFHNLIILLFFVSSPLVQNAGAAAGEERAWNVRELVERALSANPELEALEESVEAAGHKSSAAGGFPDPTFSYSHFIESVETRLGPQRNVLQLVQPVPFPGKLSLREEIAGYDALIAGEHLASARLRIVKEIKTSYHSIAAIDRILRLLDEEDRLLRHYEDIVGTRLETGRAYQQDLLKVQIERFRLEERSLQYEQRRESIAFGLNTLLDLEPGTPVIIEQPDTMSAIPASPARLKEIARNRPDLRTIDHRIEQRSRSLSLVRRGYYPDITLGMSYIDIGDAPFDVPDSGRDAWNVTIGVKLPIWFGKIRAESRAERSSIRHLERTREAEERRIDAEIEDIYNQYRIALGLVTLYRDSLVPRAEQSLSASEAGYLTGEIDFLSLLDSERILLELRISLAGKISEVEKHIAELEAAAGYDPIAAGSSDDR